MIYRLEPQDYRKVKLIFTHLMSFQPMCVTVLNQKYHGMVFVDNPDTPTSACLLTWITKKEYGLWGFLAGNPKNTAFLQSLHEGLFEKTLVDETVPNILFTPSPDSDWSEAVKTLCSPRKPIPFPRRHYSCQKLTFDWHNRVPEDIEIRRIDRSFYNNPELILHEEVRDTVEKWFGKMDGKTDDIGFAAMDGNKVAAWMTIDFVSNGVGDVGVHTLEEYRKRGLATITSAAAMEYAFAHGVKTIHWTCAADNEGSFRTANKLGYQRGEDYQIEILVFEKPNTATGTT